MPGKGTLKTSMVKINLIFQTQQCTVIVNFQVLQHTEGGNLTLLSLSAYIISRTIYAYRHSQMCNTINIYILFICSHFLLLGKLPHHCCRSATSQLCMAYASHGKGHVWCNYAWIIRTWEIWVISWSFRQGLYNAFTRRNKLWTY